MFREPPFRFLSPGLKILALIMVMIITFLVLLAVGVAFSIPFFGKGILDVIAMATEYTDPKTVAALKYFQIVNQIGVFVVPAILFVILTDDNISGYLKVNNGLKRFSIFFGFIVFAISLPFINWTLEINNAMHLPGFLSGVEGWMRDSEDKAAKLTEAFLSTGSLKGLIINLIMIAGLAAIGEELIFRGILMRLFHEWTKSGHLAVILSSLIFSAFHLQFYGFFGRFILGLILGYLFLWSGSLWVPIFLHFLNNAMAVILSYLQQKGLVDTELQNFGASDNALVIAGSFLLMVFTMTLIYLHETGYFKKKAPDI